MNYVQVFITLEKVYMLQKKGLVINIIRTIIFYSLEL